MPTYATQHHRYRIVPFGPELDGFAIERDGAIWITHPSLIYLGAFLDAVLRGADVEDARLIAKAVAARPEPTYEERLAHFTATGPWQPSRDPFPRQS
jgi:hypothetical protein